MNNKGQALVEFIVILPVLLLIIMAICDFGNIILKKYSLENDLDTVVELYNSDKVSDINNYINDNNLSIEYSKTSSFTKIVLSKNVNINTPLLNNILGKDYKVAVSRSVINDE